MPIFPIMDLTWKILLIIGAVKLGKKQYGQGITYVIWGILFMLFHFF